MQQNNSLADGCPQVDTLYRSTQDWYQDYVTCKGTAAGDCPDEDAGTKCEFADRSDREDCDASKANGTVSR